MNWLRQCPNYFWVSIENAMTHTIRMQASNLPPGVDFGRVVLNLTAEIAIISPTVLLTSEVPPRWIAPHPTPPTPTTMNGPTMLSEQNDAVVREALTASLTLENHPLLLPLIGKEETVMSVTLHQQTLSCKISIDISHEQFSIPSSADPTKLKHSTSKDVHPRSCPNDHHA